MHTFWVAKTVAMQIIEQFMSGHCLIDSILNTTAHAPRYLQPSCDMVVKAHPDCKGNSFPQA